MNGLNIPFRSEWYRDRIPVVSFSQLFLRAHYEVSFMYKAWASHSKGGAKHNGLGFPDHGQRGIVRGRTMAALKQQRGQWLAFAVQLTVDQPGVAARVQSSGAGLVLDKDKLTAKGVQRPIETVASPEYRKAAVKFRKIFLHAGGAERAADLVEI